MHGTIKRKIDRKAELSAIKREWYRAHKARLNTFLNSPQATDADKATRGDAKLSKHVGLRVASDGIPPWDRPPFDLGVFKKQNARRLQAAADRARHQRVDHVYPALSRIFH